MLFSISLWMEFSFLIICSTCSIHHTPLYILLHRCRAKSPYQLFSMYTCLKLLIYVFTILLVDKYTSMIICSMHMQKYCKCVRVISRSKGLGIQISLFVCETNINLLLLFLIIWKMKNYMNFPYVKSLLPLIEFLGTHWDSESGILNRNEMFHLYKWFR